MCKRVYKIIALTLVFVLMFGVCVSAANVRDFTDVPSNAWYYNYLEYATENGIINGVSEKSFDPDGDLTRAQFATIFGRAFGYEVEPGTKFTDVKNDSWYAGYVYWAVENGIVNGTSSTTFSPDANITRQDVATILGRYIDAFNIFLISSESALSAFVDADKISGYAVNHCNLLREVGILNGDKAGCMNPGKDMSRAEGMTVLVRLIWAIEEAEANGAGNLGGGDTGDSGDSGNTGDGSGNTGDGSGNEGNSGNEGSSGDGGETGCAHVYNNRRYFIQKPSAENGYVEITAVQCYFCDHAADIQTKQIEFSTKLSSDEIWHFYAPTNCDYSIQKDREKHDFPALYSIIESPSAINNFQTIWGRYCEVCGYLDSFAEPSN